MYIQAYTQHYNFTKFANAEKLILGLQCLTELTGLSSVFER